MSTRYLITYFQVTLQLKSGRHDSQRHPLNRTLSKNKDGIVVFLNKCSIRTISFTAKIRKPIQLKMIKFNHENKDFVFIGPMFKGTL